MTSLRPGVHVIADRRRVLDGIGWHLSPCWEHGCTIYWDNLPDGRVRIQHGENPEAVREFGPEGILLRSDGGWLNTCDLYAWLAAIHAYEAPAATTPRGRGAE